MHVWVCTHVSSAWRACRPHVADRELPSFFESPSMHVALGWRIGFQRWAHSPSCAVAFLGQMRGLFAKFDEHRELWASAVRCLSHLDAVLSLAEVSAQPGFSRPQFHDGASTPSFIRLKNARHPCLAQTYQGGEYIPNDATLGAAPAGISDDAPAAPNMLLLTGPNMGGKSTLLRQTCLVAILAQVKTQRGATECIFRFSLVPSAPCRGPRYLITC